MVQSPGTPEICASERDNPLIGISPLEAKRAAPVAVSHYYDRNKLVSANILKSLRNRGFLETSKHYVYSLHHAFEKRMQQANIYY